MPEWLIMNYVCNKYVTVASVWDFRFSNGGVFTFARKNLFLTIVARY